MHRLYGFGIAAAALFALGIAGVSEFAAAQQASLPQVTQINPNDLFQDIPNGAVGTGNVYAPASLFSLVFGAGSPTRNNAIIGGDATTNLWQRGTAGTATTSATPAYDAPDRFAQWSTSAGAGIQVSRDSASTDIFSGYQYSFKVAHTNTTAGQICVGQEVESVNSYQYQGTTAEFDFHAYVGAGYTGAATLTAYIVYGTGTDDGIGKMAFTVNAAGTSPGWAGGALATSAVIPLSTISTGGRFAAIGSIPATATEIGVAICYTAGTTSTNDYVALAGLQLVRNTANAQFANTGVGYLSGATPNLTLASFERRPMTVEATLQYRYYWAWGETVSGEEAAPGSCTAFSATVAICTVPLPVQMRINPVAAGTTCTIGTLKRTVAGAATALSAFAASTTTTYAVVSGANALACIATVASGDTAGFSGVIESGNSTGGGIIAGNAEL